jgi:DNA repair/transcription protein MET18/MMS19
MVLAGVKQPEALLRRSAVESLHNMLVAEPTAAAGDLQGLIPALLEIATASPFISARSAAVGAILEILRLPHHVVFPYKQEVVHRLAAAVDDPKFAVRKVAVRCRNRWVTMTPPE